MSDRDTLIENLLVEVRADLKNGVNVGFPQAIEAGVGRLVAAGFPLEVCKQAAQFELKQLAIRREVPLHLLNGELDLDEMDEIDAQLKDAIAADKAEHESEQKATEPAEPTADEPAKSEATTDVGAERVEPPAGRFETIARAAIARGENRVLPIVVGAKKPAIKWSGSDLDVLPAEQWASQVDAWVANVASSQFADLNACVVAKPLEFVFIDCDTYREFVAGYEAFSGETFPPTYTTSARGNRVQIHFRQTDATRTLGNVSQFAVDGVDLSVRQNNLYVLAEGSQHPTGSTYQRVVDARIIPMPDKLVEYIQHLEKRADEVTKTKNAEKVAAGQTAVVDEYPRNEHGLIIHGHIHPYMVSEAGKMRQAGKTVEEIEVELLERVHANCAPPIDDDAVRQTAQSMENYERGFYNEIPMSPPPPPEPTQTAQQVAVATLDAWLANDSTVELTTEEVLAWLSAISKLEYEERRVKISKKSGLRTSFFDAEYEKVSGKKKTDEEVSAVVALITEHRPWNEPVDLVDVLEETEAVFRQYIHFKREGDYITSALWVGQTYTVEHQSEFPYFGVRSPVEQCGKTSVLYLAGHMSYRSLKAGNISAAAAFRVINEHHPCLFIDEVDTFIHLHEDFVGILNLGHSREGGCVLRVLGENHDETTPFEVWGPKAYGMIGTAPATFASRTVPVILERATNSDGLTSFPKTPKGKDALRLRLHTIASKWKRWADDNKDAIADWEPDVSKFENRAADNWYPLLRIAEMAGEEWAKRAVVAAGVVDPYAKPDTKRLLLRDIRNIFHTRKVQGKEHETITPATLVLDLLAQPSGWNETGRFDKPISGKMLSNMLEDFGVKSSRSKGGGKAHRVYRLVDLAPVFERFLTDPPEETELGTMDDRAPGANDRDLNGSKKAA